MKVIIIDDEASLADSLKDLVLVEGYEAEVYHTLKSAREGLEKIEEPMIVILDHDFRDAGERDQVGYDLCKWLRENHPYGLLLPIIYLSGHETVDGFLQQALKEPFAHPTVFISKEQLAMDQELLPNLLKKFEHARELFEKQGAQQALIGFRDMEPEDSNYYEVE